MKIKQCQEQQQPPLSEHFLYPWYQLDHLVDLTLVNPHNTHRKVLPQFLYISIPNVMTLDHLNSR